MDDSDVKQKPVYSSKKRFPHKKRWIIGAIIVVILVGGAVCAWLFILRPKSSTPESSTEQITASAKAVGQTVLEAMKQSNNGELDDAVVTYDNAVKATEDPLEKSILLKNKAVLYVNDGKYDEALTVAKESETLNQNADTAQFIALIYEKKGDKQKAIEYYQKAILLVDKTQDLANSDIQYYQSRIEALGGAKS